MLVICSAASWFIMKKAIVISLFLGLGFIIHAQVNLDSLWGVWNNEMAPDTSRAMAMHEISWYGYLYSKPDSAFYFAQMLYDFGKEKGMKNQMAQALNTQGVSYYVRSDYFIAMSYYQKSLKICEEISDKKRMASILNNTGLIYSRKGYHLKALEYYQRSLKIYEEISDKSRMAGALNNIGVICVDQGDYPKAMEYFQRCLILSEEISDKRRMAASLNNIGLCYSNQGGYAKAIDCYKRSFKIHEEIANRRGMASVLEHIGDMYKIRKEYDIALDYFKRCLTISKEISDKRAMVNALNYIGDIHNELGDHKQAILWCEKGLLTSKEISTIEEQRDACGCLYHAFKALGNDSKALHYHERIIVLNDSLQAEETTKKIQQMEFAKQMLADSLLQEEEKLRVQMAHEAEVRKKNRTRNIYIITAILLLIFAVGYHRRMVLVRKAKRAIDYEKDRSDNLLLNILPPEIADELKEKGRAKARKFDSVSVLFTDFKGFTQISEKLSAEELVEEINTCFKEFDAICNKYGVEKIKTIGDAYMAAGGLPVPGNDSVKHTVLAGLEMKDFMIRKKQKCDAEGNLCFEMRLGIHTGSIVAGIVGVTKFQYDIWGDAVNIASQMESSGEVGKINISQTTYELIKEDPVFQFHPRGKVKTKGKGAIEMWFVENT